MKKLKVGIIGQGRSGCNIHAHVLNLLPEQYTIAAVTDLMQERRDAAVKNFGCDAYESHLELLDRKDLDLVVNASPSHLHVPLSELFIDAGFNVLCEKPLASKVADVDRLIAKSKKSGNVFAVYQQSRFAPYFQQVKSVIDSGVLGKIVLVKIAFNSFARRWDWQTLKKMNGGNLLNTGPHPLDQALHFVGRDAMPQVICDMDNLNSSGDAEDHVKLILRREGYPTVDVEVSSCAAYSPYTYMVYGSRGGLTGTMTDIQWKYFDESQCENHESLAEPMPNLGYCSEKLPWVEENWRCETKEEGAMNQLDLMGTQFYLNLHKVLTQGAELEVKLADVRQQIAVIEEAHRQNLGYSV